LALIVFATGCSQVNPEGSIEVGQIWKQTLHEDDPYQKAEIYYKEVIEITGDYVLFVQNKKDTLHQKKYWFVVSSECIKQ